MGHFTKLHEDAKRREEKLDHIIFHHPDIPEFPDKGAVNVLAVLAGLALGGIIALVIAYSAQLWNATGAAHEAGTWYGFWSGFGGAIPDFLILASIATALYHGNCHQKGCWRWGHKLEGTPYRVCHRHHPGRGGAGRNVSEAEIKRAHREAKGTA